MAQTQKTCTCEAYQDSFKQYRAAKDIGNNAGAEEVAFQLSRSPLPFCRVLGLDLLANVKVNSSKMVEGLSFINREKRLLDSLQCSNESYLEYFITKSFYHYSQDEYDSSVANSLKALTIAEQTQDVARQIALRLGIGSAFYHNGQKLKKLEYARSIIVLIQKVKNPSLQCQYYIYLWDTYFSHFTETDRDGNFLDSANLYNSRALAIAKATGNKRFLFYCYGALEKMNKETNGSVSKGLIFIDSALYFGKGSINDQQLSEMLIDKANYLFQLGRKEQAISLADSGLHISALHSQKSIHASHLVEVSQLYSKLGNYQKALELYQEADAISDSIQSIDNARIVGELEEKYNKAKNEKIITTLSQEKHISQLQIRVLVFGVVIALVAIILIVFVYRLSLLKKKQEVIESKYRLNQALVNPHFLSNALVSIQRFMMENNTVQASNYLTKFSRLMRQLLEYSREELITIEEEIELLSNYLDIQKLRLKNRFDYEVKIDQNLSLSDSKIQPMFAQPFVENAIEHGVANIENGKIEISFSSQGDKLLLAISDNGKGISLSSSEGHQSLSTKIIRERIALLNKTNKKPIELTIDNITTGTGTRVQLTLPIYS
jgi:two-component sensor histidine kinase